MLGKVSDQGGHSSLFSGSKMMHVVTEKQNGGRGGTNILEKVTEPADPICPVYCGPFNCALITRSRLKNFT